MTFDLSTSLVSLAVILYALVAVGDLRSREIPNLLVLAVFVLGCGKTVLFGSLTEAAFNVGAAVIAFVVVFPLFAAGALGGGDTKLIPASVLLVGYDDALSFIVGMSLLGGALSLFIILIQTVKNRLRAGREHRPLEMPTVPYGVAIAGAAVTALLQLPPLLQLPHG
jgi:prepilin peptidase CpaA